MGESDDDFDADGDESNLVRDLRKQLKALKKSNDEAAEKLSKFEKQERLSTVADLVKDAGADARFAKFYTGEDTSKEAVAAWVDENKELFGIATPAEEPEYADDVRKISQAAANAPQHKIGSMQDHIDRIKKAKTPQELQDAYKAAGLILEQ